VGNGASPGGLETPKTAYSDAQRDADNRTDLARRYLEAGAEGGPCADLASALAGSVMQSEMVRLAMAVMAGGDHAHAQATKLAELIASAGAGTVEAEGQEPSTGTEG
jgi:hypothetical protein